MTIYLSEKIHFLTTNLNKTVIDQVGQGQQRHLKRGNFEQYVHIRYPRTVPKYVATHVVFEIIIPLFLFPKYRI